MGTDNDNTNGKDTAQESRATQSRAATPAWVKPVGEQTLSPEWCRSGISIRVASTPDGAVMGVAIVSEPVTEGETQHRQFLYPAFAQELAIAIKRAADRAVEVDGLRRAAPVVSGQ